MTDIHRPSDVSSFLVWGGWYGSRNIGDSAILLGLKELIYRFNDRDRTYIRALSTDPDYTATNGVTGERALLTSDIFRPWNWLRLVNSFRKSDRIIISGGTPVYDSSHLIRTIYLALPVFLRVPFVVFGVGAKPITSWFGRHAIPRLLNRAVSVSVRDEPSLSVLRALGVRKVELTADSAFFARPASDDELNEILAHCGIGDDDSLLIVAPRLLSEQKERFYLEEQMDQQVIETVPRAIVKAIDAVAHRFDRIVVIAMHYHGPDSDAPIARRIVKSANTAKITFLDQEIRPEAAIALLRRATVVLGVRLHSLLLAASMGTPIVGIAYETKVQGLHTRLGVEDYCLDLFDLRPHDLIETLNRALDRRAVVAESLNRRVEKLRAKVLKDAETSLSLSSHAPNG